MRIKAAAIDKEMLDIFLKAQQYKGVKRIGIFGSYARNEQTNASDMDVLFEYYYNDDSDNGIDDMLCCLDELEANLKQFLGNIKIDFVSYNGIMESSSKLVRQHILNDTIWVYNRENIINN